MSEPADESKISPTVSRGITAGPLPELPPLLPPQTVLAWSEALLDETSPDRPILALWRPAGKNVAIGISQDPERELEVAALRRDGVGLVRRQSGGGAVLLFPGVLCWEALARLDVIDGMGGSGIRETYRVLCTPVVTALRSLGIDAFHAGVCDISCTDGPDRLVYKLAGTAQLRRRTMALVHGSLLVTADVAELGRYLKQPSEEPDYRAGRGHDDFCRTVAEMIGAGTDKDGYQNRNGYGHRNGTANGRESGDENGGESDNGHGFMDNAVLSRMVTAIDATARTLGFETVSPPSSLTQAATKLAEGKYRNDEWNWRRIRPKEARDRP